MRMIPPVIAAALPALISVGAGATTIVDMDFADLCAEADVVVVAVVDSVETRRAETGDYIYTFTGFHIVEWIDGAAPRDHITIQTLGGTVDGETMRVHGMPRFERGREYLLFLKLEGSSLCPVVGWTRGCFSIERDKAGNARVRTYAGLPVVAIDADRIRTLASDGRAANFRKSNRNAFPSRATPLPYGRGSVLLDPFSWRGVGQRDPTCLTLTEFAGKIKARRIRAAAERTTERGK